MSLNPELIQKLADITTKIDKMEKGHVKDLAAINYSGIRPQDMGGSNQKLPKANDMKNVSPPNILFGQNNDALNNKQMLVKKGIQSTEYSRSPLIDQNQLIKFHIRDQNQSINN